MMALSRIQATLNHASRAGADTSAPSDLKSLAESMNRIVLPRRITLRLADKTMVSFHVANRRLHRMENLGQTDLPWNSSLHPSLLEPVVAALRQLPEAAPWDGVDLPIADSATSCDGLGISALDLLTALNPVPQDAVIDDLQARIASFGARYPGQIEASFLMADSAIAPLSGESETVDRVYASIAEPLARLADPNSSFLSALETDGTLALPLAPPDEGAILITGEVGMLGVLVTRDWSPMDVLDTWRRDCAA